MLPLVCLFFAFIAVPAIALAQAASLPADPGAILALLVSGLHSGKYGLAVAGVLAGVVWLFKSTSLGSKLPKALYPWLATLLSVIGALGANLQAGMPWGDAIFQGVVVGKAAVGLWESTLQHIVAWVAGKLKLAMPSPPT